MGRMRRKIKELYTPSWQDQGVKAAPQFEESGLPTQWSGKIFQLIKEMRECGMLAPVQLRALRSFVTKKKDLIAELMGDMDGAALGLRYRLVEQEVKEADNVAESSDFMLATTAYSHLSRMLRFKGAKGGFRRRAEMLDKWTDYFKTASDRSKNIGEKFRLKELYIMFNDSTGSMLLKRLEGWRKRADEELLRLQGLDYQTAIDRACIQSLKKVLAWLASIIQTMRRLPSQFNLSPSEVSEAGPPPGVF